MAFLPVPPEWSFHFMTMDYVHIPTGLTITQEILEQTGFPPPDLKTEFEIRTWIFQQITSGRERKAELLVCVEFYTDHTPKLRIYVDSLVWLQYQTSKDLVWHSFLPTQSPQPIKLWGKDFILIQITQHGSDPINALRLGCRLSRQGNTAQGEAPRVPYPDSEIKNVRFLCISDLQ